MRTWPPSKVRRYGAEKPRHHSPTELPMPLNMKLTAITLDCPDSRALAAFYH